MIRLLLALGLAVTSLVMFGAAPASACSCAQQTVAQQASSADAVFLGSVTARSGDDQPGTRSRETVVTYDVAVSRVWKGEVPVTATVSTSGQGTACGLPNLPEGEPLVWFVSLDGDGFSTNSCQGTGASLPALQAEVVAALGEPTSPARPAGSDPDADAEADSSSDGAPLWTGLGLAGALLAGAAAAYVVVRRRRSA